MKLLIRTLQVALGLIFVFGGIAKCIDPTGTSIKFNEYLLFFGWNQLVDFTMGLAWLLSIVEFAIGFMFLVGRGKNPTLILAVAMMLVFTPLTLWLAVSDAIQDCGCFGDAVHLSNWQTFGKNVLIDIALVLVIWKKEQLYELLGKTNAAFYFYWCLFVAVGLCWFGTFRDPVIDFRPFHPGVNIAQSVLLQDDNSVPQDVIYTCLYEKDGIRKEFPLEELPDEEDGWVFIETIEHVSDSDSNIAEDDPMKENATQKPLDFFVRTTDGELFTERLLEEPGYTILLLSASLEKASQHDLDRIERLYEYAIDQKYPFYCITKRDTLQLNAWIYNTGAEYPFLFTDEQIVETITRANPGILVLRNGVICWKENLSTLDVNTIVSAKLDEQIYGEINEIDYQKRFLALMILLFGPLPLSLCFEIPKFIKIITKKQTKNA